MTGTDPAEVPATRRLVAWVVGATGIVGAPLAHGLHIVNGSFDVTSLATTGVLFCLLGALVVLRQPTNVLGPVLATIGVLSVVGATAEAVTTVTFGTRRLEVPGAVWAGWVGDWYWVPTVWLQFVAIPLLFPDGEFASRRWRRVCQAALGVAGVSTVLAAAGQEIVLDGVQLGLPANDTTVVSMSNPVALLPLGNFERDVEVLLPLLPLFAVCAVASLVLRFRRSEADARRQLQVVVVSTVVAVAGFALYAALDLSRMPVLHLLGLPMILLIPVSLGVGILRYRLYDIDRIVSRTVAWVLVSAVLVGAYLGGVVVLQSLLRPVIGEGDLPVALATLGAAATARPLLRRVQDVVDRRFNRAHYDAARTLDEFARSLRDEVSRDAVVETLRRTASATVAPSSASVHIVVTGVSP